mmetsp:Transcript_16559/g.62638  ORF Transcript_16559/g.62638 Transcript_16559/m.62638 type:complete len:311 (+) Transcript_16559:2492-3424(+)
MDRRNGGREEAAAVALGGQAVPDDPGCQAGVRDIRLGRPGRLGLGGVGARRHAEGLEVQDALPLGRQSVAQVCARVERVAAQAGLGRGCAGRHLGADEAPGEGRALPSTALVVVPHLGPGLQHDGPRHSLAERVASQDHLQERHRVLAARRSGEQRQRHHVVGAHLAAHAWLGIGVHAEVAKRAERGGEVPRGRVFARHADSGLGQGGVRLRPANQAIGHQRLDVQVSGPREQPGAAVGLAVEHSSRRHPKAGRPRAGAVAVDPHLERGRATELFREHVAVVVLPVLADVAGDHEDGVRPTSRDDRIERL